MEENLQRLKQRLHEVMDLRFAQSLAGWDQQTYMPKGGAEARGHMAATLASVEHEKFTSEEVGRLLESLQPYAEQLGDESDDARLIELTRIEYDRAMRTPQKWVIENAMVTTVAHSAWENARKTANFALFQPELERVIELRREYAGFFAPYDHIYDPLLDNYERGMKTAEIQAIFNQLRPQQAALIRQIAGRPQVDDSFFNQPYPEQAQWDFGVEVVSRFGYDWNHGRQDRAAHPFTTDFGMQDVRITTRFDSQYPASSLFSTMHEGGHAMYEQGISTTLARTPLAMGASMAIHELQSRMYENMVGRSLAFWRFFYPRLQSYFPTQLGSVPLETFYCGINKVQPSLIRVELDEATYNLHIMLRMELEIALMEGSLSPADLPEAWNARMQEYLGLTPPNDAAGVLQDVHWSSGLIGYFPTYALGNLVAAQLWAKIQQEIPNLYEQFEQGEFSSLLAWLREHVHRYGAKYRPQELVEKVTGEKINPQPYLDYLKAKYSEIYGL